jgi:hypothetical protein
VLQSRFLSITLVFNELELCERRGNKFVPVSLHALLNHKALVENF